MNKIQEALENPKIQWLLLGLEFIAIVIVFSTLTGGTGVDWDEAYTHRMVVKFDFMGMLRETAADVHPPLYYIICKIMVRLFGDHLSVFTWTSMIPALLSVILSSIFIRKRFGVVEALLFNFVLAFAPYLLFYNCNIRMYSWMNFFVLGVLLMTIEIRAAEQKASGGCWILLFLFSIGGVYTQYFAALPITIFYLYLIIVLLLQKRWKDFGAMICVGVLDIAAYLPWLSVLLDTLGSNTQIAEDYEFVFSPLAIAETFFGCNLENTAVIAVIICGVAVILPILLRDRYEKATIEILYLLIINTILSILGGQAIGAMNGHFFSLRYVIFVEMFLWLVIILVYGKMHYAVVGALIIWTGLLGMSAYRTSQEYEYQMTPLMPKTMEFIETNIDDDALLVYDYATFDVIYDYYIPGHEIVFFDDLNLEEYRGETFWFLSMWARDFSEEQIDQYGLQIERYNGYGFMGMEQFNFIKVTVGE